MPAPANLLKGFARTVANTKPDPTKRLAISDPDTRGLYVRITPKGAKTWTIVARDPAGKQVWREIGPVDEIDIEDARNRAREGVKRIKQGLPAFEDKRAPETVKQVSQRFIDEYVKDKERKLRTGDEVERIFTKYVWPKVGSRIFAALGRGEITKMLRELKEENGAVQADRVLAAMSKLCNWYALEDDHYSSPIVRGMGFTKSRERARIRILNDDEIRDVWKAAGDMGTFGAFVRTCLLTSQRRAKVAEMRWADISDEGIWTIPAEAREKANAGELALPPMALAIVNAQPKVKKNPFVFAGRGDKAIVGFSKCKAELDKKAATAPWVLHDLRRTAKSLMARAGVRPDVSERVLGHTIAGVEGVYDRHTYAKEKAEALAKLAGLVELILNPPKGNVVPMKGVA